MMSDVSRLFTRNRPGCHLTPRLRPSTMTPMVAPKKRQRVQGIKVHFDPPLLAWLRLEAARLDVSTSELLRHFVRKEMGA